METTQVTLIIEDQKLVEHWVWMDVINTDTFRILKPHYIIFIRRICIAEGILHLATNKSEGFDNCERPTNLTQCGFKSSIFHPVWPWNFMDDPEK